MPAYLLIFLMALELEISQFVWAIYYVPQFYIDELAEFFVVVSFISFNESQYSIFLLHMHSSLLQRSTETLSKQIANLFPIICTNNGNFITFEEMY